MESSMQKISKALKRLLKWTESHTGIYSIQVSPKRDDPMRVAKEKDRAISQARKALALPMRNCDVGTADEQSNRFEDYCMEHKNGGSCRECSFNENLNMCALEWAQMPCEAQEGESNGVQSTP